MERTPSAISTHASILHSHPHDAGLNSPSSNYPVAQANLDSGRRTSRTFPPSFTTRDAKTVDPSTTSLRSPLESRKLSYGGIVSYRDEPGAVNVKRGDDNPFSDEHETVEGGGDKRAPRKYSDYASSPSGGHARKPSGSPTHASASAGLSKGVLSAGEASGSSPAVQTKDWAPESSYTFVGKEHSVNPAQHMRQGSGSGHVRNGSGGAGGGDRRRSSAAQGILGALKEYIKPAAPEGRFE
jgi:hypothetical protein